MTDITRTAKEIAKAAFPEYKGRKIGQTSVKPEVTIYDNYWDGGTRSYYVAIRVSDLKRVELPGLNPMRNAECRVTLPGGVVLVRNSWFCGKDCGLTVMVPSVPEPAQIGGGL